MRGSHQESEHWKMYIWDEESCPLSLFTLALILFLSFFPWYFPLYFSFVLLICISFSLSFLSLCISPPPSWHPSLSAAS